MVPHLRREFTPGDAGGGSCISCARSRNWHGTATLGRRIALIKYAHKLAGHPAPTDDERVKATMRGIRRSIRTAPRKKSPATAERVIAMTPGARTDMKGLRDRALLLFGFAGAFRRSEIVALDSLRAGFLTSAAK